MTQDTKNILTRLSHAPSEALALTFQKLTGIDILTPKAKYYSHLSSILKDCYTVDLVAIGDEMDRLDPEYDNLNNTYKDSPCSLKEYMDKKFGRQAANIICYLILADFNKEFNPKINYINPLHGQENTDQEDLFATSDNQVEHS